MLPGQLRYFNEYFAEHPVITALGPDFWPVVAELAGQLGIQGRALLFAPLWGETAQLTVMCVRLLQALEELGNAELAFCTLDALDPQAMSILDAETMMHGLEDESMPAIWVSTLEGRQIELARPVVAALAAELHLTLEEQPFGFFSSADLLDFPGAPPRSRFTEPDSLYADPTNRARHFRRGKAAYLFQRYVANQELTALVLCMEDAPPVARTLPEMVREWIDAAQGATPEERRDMPCALFVALTKFDQELKEELRQKEDDPEHWARRLKGVFDDFLCRNDRWSDRWAPGRAFNNVYWLRNPAIAEPEVLQYNASGRETGLVDRGRIARMRGRFISAPAARQHFIDPTRAWDEALKLNDGGVSYLAGQLRPVCDPELRRRQIAELLAGLARDMHQCLEPFYVAASPARAAAAAAADAVADTDTRVDSTADTWPTGAAARDASGTDPALGDAALGDAALTDAALADAALAGSAALAGEATAGSQTTDGTDDAAAKNQTAKRDPTDSMSPLFAVAEAMAAMPAPTDERGSRLKWLLAAGVAGLLVIGGGAYFLLSPSAPPANAPSTTAANVPDAGPTAPAPPPAISVTTPPTPGPVSTGQITTATNPPPPPPPTTPTRCGPIETPERLANLPANVTLSPMDLVCVSRAWISVGRAGDAVMQLTRALQNSPRRIFGPAALELGKLYDPLRPNPNWPPNAVYAAEKYQDAIADGNFPDTQREAQANLEALRKAPLR